MGRSVGLRPRHATSKQLRQALTNTTTNTEGIQVTTTEATEATRTTAESMPEDGTITTSGTIAVLPTAVLWAVAKAAATPDKQGRDRILDIDVRRYGDGLIRMAATDGHRVHVCAIPQSEQWFISSEQVASIRLNPNAFRKSPNASSLVSEIDSGGSVYFSDGHGTRLSMGRWTPRVDVCAYPAIDQLFPSDDTLTCDPRAAIALDARYLGDVASIFAKLSPSRPKSGPVARLFSTESPNAPVVLRAEIDPAHLLEVDPPDDWCPVVLSCLIMPVQIRG